MNSILKHTLRSVLKNKIQAGIIVLTVVLVTALLFAAFSLSDVFYLMNATEQRRLAADADMLLGSADPYGQIFNKEIVESLIEDGDIVYANYFLRTNTIMKTEKVSKSVIVEATDLNEYLNNNKLNFVSVCDSSADEAGERFLPAVIGKTFAESIGVETGSQIEIYLSSIRSYVQLTVVYIAADEGIFTSVSAMNILTDLYALSGGGLINSAYIKFSSPSLFSKYEKIFAKNLPDVPVTDAQINESAREIAKNSTMLMAVAVIFIAAAMMLILLTSYLIIARHRMSDMIIFKACGATPGQVTLIMLLEVFVYALTGALIGLVIGRLFMHIAVARLLPVGRNLIKYQFWKYLLSFIISVSVCVTACLLPVISTSKKTIRELNSSPQKVAKKGKPLNAAVSLALIVASLIAVNFLSGIYIIIFIVFFIAAAAFFIAAAAPIVIKFTSALLSKIRQTGGVFLSAQSAKRSKGIQTVSVLLIVLIGFSFMASEVVNVVKISRISYLTRYVADYIAVCDGNRDLTTQNLIKEELVKIDGVENSGFFGKSVFLMPDSDQTFGLHGVNDEWTLLHCSKDGLSKGTVERWNSCDNPIVLPEDMMLRYNLKIGDTVSYESANYNYMGEIFNFTIVGIDHTATEWDFVGFIKFSAIEQMAYGSTYLITAADTAGNKDELFLRVREAVENMQLSLGGETVKIDGLYALEFAEWAYAGKASLTGLNSLLSFLQIFLFVVCFLGIINITIVTVYDRKHEFILYKLSGMTSADYLKFSLGEGLLAAVSSGLTGLLLCFALNMLLPSITSLINKFLNFGFFPINGLIILSAASVFFMATWLLIAFFNRKINILHINGKYNY